VEKPDLKFLWSRWFKCPSYLPTDQIEALKETQSINFDQCPKLLCTDVAPFTPALQECSAKKE